MRRRRMAGGERFDATAGDREAWTPDDHEENAAFRNESRVKRIGCGGGELTLGRWPEKTAAAAENWGDRTGSQRKQEFCYLGWLMLR